MNTKLSLFIALIITLGHAPLAAQSINKTHPETMAASIDKLVKLSPAQREQISVLCLQWVNELKALPGDAPSHQSFEITKRMRQRVREQLNPEQRHLYNRSKQTDGGGCMIPGPDIQLKTLESLVSLNENQKALALETFTRAFNQLVEVPETDTTGARAALRKRCDEDIYKLLTPEQRQKIQAKLKP